MCISKQRVLEVARYRMRAGQPWTQHCPCLQAQASCNILH